MTSSDPREEVASGKYNIRIGSAQGPVIGDNLHVEQHFHTPPSSVLDGEQRRNRSRMLAKVRSIWITGFLDQSLHGAAMLALRLHEQTSAVTNPWELVVQSPNQSEHGLPEGNQITHMYAAFEEFGGELLILGDPGAGKTTLLLDLARDLLDRAVQDDTYPIPVIFNLSSWALKRQPLTNWLIEELNSKYQVPPKLGQVWVAKNQLTLLLDGLDEVKKEDRAACIEAINTYRQEHGLVPTVVCSRRADYFSETRRLQLRSAVLVQPLTNEQIETYLSGAGEQLEAVRALLRNDPALQELATSPLMLSVLTLAYAGKSVESLQKVGLPTRRQVFADYVERMLQRRGAETRYTPQQTHYWLTWLAQQLTQHSQSEFYIERIQPGWLPARLPLRSYRGAARLATGLFCALFGLFFFGLVPGLILWLPVNFQGVSAGPVTKLLSTLSSGLLMGLLFGLTRRVETEIRPAEVIVWSWRNMWHKLIKSGFMRTTLPSTLLFTLVMVLFYALVLEPSIKWSTVLLSGLLVGSLNGVVGGAISRQVSKRLDEQTPMAPQKRYHPIRNRVLVGLSAGLLNIVLLIWVLGPLILVSAFINGLIVALTHEVKIEIKLIKFTLSLGVSLWRSIRWRRVKGESLKNGFIAGGIICLPIGLLIGLSTAWSLRGLVLVLLIVLSVELVFGLMITALLGLINVFIGGLASDLLDKQALVAPNQGIRLSARNSIVVGLLGGLLSELIFWLFFGPVGGLDNLYAGLFYGLPIGLASGLILGLSNGGAACIQHWVLRWFLWRTGYIPWNYTHFLDYAAERILLRKVGGGYVFVHRLLLDYFAAFNTVVKAETPEQVVFKQTDMCGCGYKETRPGARFCSNCGKPKQVTNGESRADISSRPTEPS